MTMHWYRARWAQWIASTLVAAIETSLFGLMTLVAIIWSGEAIVFGASVPGVARLAELSLILLLVVLPPLLVVAIVLLWPLMLGLSAVLWLPTRRSCRLVAPAVTLIWTTAIGAFGTWRLYRRLGRIAEPVASAPLCA